MSAEWRAKVKYYRDKKMTVKNNKHYMSVLIKHSIHYYE